MPDGTQEPVPHWTAGLAKMNQGKPLAHPDAFMGILSRYEAGESIDAIARSLSITSPAVYRYLLRHGEQEWREYQTAQAIHEYQAARVELKGATDGVTVSRARELARMAWNEMASLKSNLYGAKQAEVTVNIGVSLDQALGGAASELLQKVSGRVIDGVAEAVQQSPNSGPFSSGGA